MNRAWSGAVAATATMALVVGLVSCSGTTRSAESFCEQLTLITGPESAEARFDPGDPSRLPSLVAELTELLDRAPDDISTATATVAEFFDAYHRAPREDRRGLLAANERRLAAASAELDAYALDTCGLFLQRAVPTPEPVPSAQADTPVAPD